MRKSLFLATSLLVHATSTSTFVVTQGTSSQADGFLRSMKESCNDQCTLRAIVRDASSPGSLALAAFGVELHECASANADCYQAAFDKADGLFAITFAMTEPAELAQAQVIADAARAANVRRIVVSSGDKLEQEPYRALGVKNRVESIFRSMNLDCAYIHTSFFYENMVQKQNSKRVHASADGHSSKLTNVVFTLPLWADEAIPMMASSDVGRVAAVLLQDPSMEGKFGRVERGSIVRVAGDLISPQEFVEAYSAASGVAAKYTTTKPEFLLENLPAGHSREMAELVATMYRWYERGYPGHERDVKAIRSEWPLLQTAKEWMDSTGVKLVQSAVE